MDFLKFFIDLFLNLDVVLKDWVQAYGLLIYAMLFLVIFLETGLVVTPFLPGDSLLFTAGAIAAVASGGLNIWVLLAVLLAAAILGDAANYMIGRRWGRAILDSGRLSRIITPERITDTEAFFERHGGKTISLARFMPFIRTFAPFIAGIGQMKYSRFGLFNIAGAIGWVALFVGAGYFFGNIPWIAHNLEYLVIGIILVSIAPALIHWAMGKLKQRRNPTLPQI